jgi:anti-sigma B factor antagonist
MPDTTLGAPYEIDRSGAAYVLVRVMGPLDSQTAPALSNAFATLFAEGRRFIAVDLMRTHRRIAGRHGLAPLIGALKSARDRGGELYLIGPCDMVRRVLGYTTDRPLKVFPTVDELDRWIVLTHPSLAAGR